MRATSIFEPAGALFTTVRLTWDSNGHSVGQGVHRLQCLMGAGPHKAVERARGPTYIHRVGTSRRGPLPFTPSWPNGNADGLGIRLAPCDEDQEVTRP